MPNKIAVRLLVDRLGFEYVLVVLRDQVFESRFECIEGVTEGEELIEIHGE